MLRFYPQYKIDDFDNMDVKTFRTLYSGMVCVQAEEGLSSMETSAYSNMDESSRRKTHRKYYERAFPENFENRPLKTSELRLI